MEGRASCKNVAKKNGNLSWIKSLRVNYEDAEYRFGKIRDHPARPTVAEAVAKTEHGISIAGVAHPYLFFNANAENRYALRRVYLCSDASVAFHGIFERHLSKTNRSMLRNMSRVISNDLKTCKAN